MDAAWVCFYITWGSWYKLSQSRTLKDVNPLSEDEVKQIII